MVNAEDVVRGPEDVEALRAENERLAQAAPTVRSRRARTGWGIVLALLAALLVALAVPALWLNRVVFDTDTWVETVAPLADDPSIQDAVAEQASTALIARLDAQERLEQLLPDQLDQFAPVLATSVESTVRTQAGNVVRSDEFAELWRELNRNGHQALLASITGREGVVTVERGTFTLDIGLLVDRLKGRLEDRGLDFVARIPTESIDRTIVLFQSDALAAAGPVLDAVQAAAIVIPVAGLLVLAGAFALAADRRRVALWFGAAVVLLAVLPLQALYLSQYAVVNQLQQLANVPAPAAQSAFQIVSRDFVTAERTLAVLGLLVWIGAIVAGPARWAVALRRGLSGGIEGAASHLELGRFGTWVGTHKRGLRVAGFVLAAVVLLLLPAPRTVAEILWIALGLIVWLIAVEFFGAAGQPPPAQPTTHRGVPT